MLAIAEPANLRLPPLMAFAKLVTLFVRHVKTLLEIVLPASTIWLSMQPLQNDARVLPVDTLTL